MAYVKNEEEKADGMKSFQWKRKLENMSLLFNVFATIWFLWHSSLFHLTVQAFWFSYAKLMLLFSNSFHTFLLLNAILFSLYALSDRKNVGGSGDLCNEFLNYSESCFKITETTEEEKQFERELDNSSDNAVTCSEVLDETVTAVTEATTTTTTTCCTTVIRKNTTTLTGEKKCHRKVKRRVAVAPRQELKRYNTCYRRQVEGPLCYVEQLSEEEFNRAVEDFIAKHKRMMQLEKQRESEYLDETVTAVTETTATTTTTCCTTVSRKSTTTGTGEKKCYRKMERRVAVAPGQELKRYNTMNTCYSRQHEGRLCYVEQLSEEDFNRAVEDFIAKHKRMQLEEQRESENMGRVLGIREG